MTDAVDVQPISNGDPAVSVARRAAFLQKVLVASAGVPALVVLVVTWLLVNVVVAVAASVLVGVGVSLWLRASGAHPDRRILDSFASVEVDQVRHARLINLVDGLALVSGVTRPELRVCEGDHPFAMVVASDATTGLIVVSHGAVSGWDRMETEAVLAHLLVRLRSGDAALTASVLMLAESARKVGLGGAARWLLARVLDPSSVLAADVSACLMTRYPPAMVSALEKLLHESRPGATVGVPDVMAPLCFAASRNDTTSTDVLPNVESFHPPLADRIALCKEI